MIDDLLWQNALKGDYRSIARCISLIENEVPGYDGMLRTLPVSDRHQVIGITGPPGCW